MKSQAAWDFAQQFSGKELFKWGIVLIICSIVGFTFPLDKTIAIISGLVILGFLITVLIIRTEVAIKKHSDMQK